MKAVEIIHQLQDLIELHGNIEVGKRNLEFNCFEAINYIELKKASTGVSFLSSDDASLGNTFIAIG